MNILQVFFWTLVFDFTSIRACRQLNKIQLDSEMKNIDLNHNALKQKFPDEYRSLNILSKHIIAEDKKSLDYFTSKVVVNICLIMMGSLTGLLLISCLAYGIWKAVSKFRNLKELLDSQAKERAGSTWKAM